MSKIDHSSRLIALTRELFHSLVHVKEQQNSADAVDPDI